MCCDASSIRNRSRRSSTAGERPQPFWPRAHRNRHWSARGIGRAIAELAASTGADMVIIDILDPLAHETAVAIAAFIVDRPQP
jgi:hypothetical protein